MILLFMVKQNIEFNYIFAILEFDLFWGAE